MSSFTIFMEYIKKGGNIKEQVRKEAYQRALRYKNEDANHEEDEDEKEDGKDGTDGDGEFDKQ